METARTLSWLRRCARGLLAIRLARQTIDQRQSKGCGFCAGTGSTLRRAFGVTLLAGASFCVCAQSLSGPSTVDPAASASAGNAVLSGLMPGAFFVQVGAGTHVNTWSVGAIWQLPWQRDTSFGRLATSIEASFGQWQTHGQRQHTRPFGQFGLTPSLRFFPDAWHGQWFVEAGVGANMISPAYHTDGKRFSTAFNFGDHLAIGRAFGSAHQQEMALRIEHFSNAGIDQPNPGEDFLQLRWVVWR
jgi:lipid A 3-O-deacylase